MLVLFVMPAVLVVVMSLVQENILKIMGETSTQMLFVDLDGDPLGRTIEEKLIESGSIDVVKEIDGRQITEKEALSAILNGNFQFCVIIPRGFAKAVKARTRQSVSKSLFNDQLTADEIETSIPDLIVYFDPAVRGGFRSSVLNALNQATLGMEIKEKMKMFSELVPKKINQSVKEMLSPFGAEDLAVDVAEMQFKLNENRLLEISENPATSSIFEKTPSSVQQNVPAWALFGMFFIVVPMAGALIREKQDGTLSRLMTMPVSYLTLIFGKVLAYILVCLSQFALILLIGRYVLPMLGTPMLEMGTNPAAIFIITLSAALAATGYGILLGTLASSFEQASMFGPISIVIAAAIGGIMVPVYAMPKMIKALSILSPLNWGHDAFLDIFIRGGDVRSIIPEALSLFLLFGVMMLISWFFLFRKIRTG